jgi:hypothetical protein
VIRFPLRYARANLVIGPAGEAASLYRLATAAYPFLPPAGKWRLLRQLERLVEVVGADFSLWRVQRAQPPDRYTEQVERLVDWRYADPEGLHGYVEAHAVRLRGLESWLPEVYLAVSLSAAGGVGIGSELVRSVDRARRRLEELAGVAAPQPISGRELEALAVAEQRSYERLAGVLSLRRASCVELQWLVSRCERRGVGEPRLEGSWGPDALVARGPDGSLAYEPLEHDLWRCVNAPLSEDPAEPPSLEVEAQKGRSFQALLCLGSLPEEAAFPGPTAELLHAPLEQVDFPVDVVVHARWVGNREALAQVRRRIVDVDHAWREQAEGALAGPGLLAEDDRLLAREYEAALQGSARPPMLYASISLAVGAPTRDELERRVQALRERYGEVELHRPRGLQHQLFFDHLLRPDGGTTRDYTAQMTAEQFGALVPTATHQVGSEQGLYIGYCPTGVRRPVWYDPAEPSRESRPSGVLLVGTLGSGKTIAAQTIAFAAERLGSLVIDFDPRPDHRLDRVSQLDGRVDVIELSGDPDHRGKLDPLRIGLAELREDLASSFLVELLRDPPPAWENEIQRAVRDAVNAGGQSLLDVVERLARSERPAAREAGDALEVVADFGLARLGFGTGEEPPLEAARPVTTIRTPGLTLPDTAASRETYTRSERVSVAVLALVAALSLRLVASDRARHKLVVLDEAWFLLASSQGRALLNRLVRLSRGFNATVLLVSQRVPDLAELTDLVGTYFIFGQETEREATNALVLLGREPTDSPLVTRVMGFRRGRCLMRDLDGRVGEVQVDPAVPGLLEALDNAPSSVAA